MSPGTILCYLRLTIGPHRYNRLGYEWAGSLLAFIALACCAIPYLFYFKGAAIRKHSKYAYSGEPGMAATKEFSHA